MIYPAPATLQLYKKTLIFTIKFTLNFFLPPFRFILLPVMLSAFGLKLPHFCNHFHDFILRQCPHKCYAVVVLYLF